MSIIEDRVFDLMEENDEEETFEIMELTPEQIGEMEYTNREEFKEEIYRKLSLIPISDDFKQHLLSITMLYYDQDDFYDISVGNYLSYLFKALYYNMTIDIIDREIVLEDKTVEKIIRENVKALVSKFNERFVDNPYRVFFIDTLRKLLYNVPMLSNITFQDNQWELSTTSFDLNKDHKLYYHKDTTQVIKKVYADGREEIFQAQYFIYEDDGETYCSHNSTINITGYSSWGVKDVLIRKEDVQKFINEYNFNGVTFEQTVRS